MTQRNWDNLPFLKRKPPRPVEPKTVGWILSFMLAVVGLTLMAIEVRSPSSEFWANFFSGLSYVALAVIICPRTPIPFWSKLLTSAVAALFVL